jgi:hypothetical protein
MMAPTMSAKKYLAIPVADARSSIAQRYIQGEEP